MMYVLMIHLKYECVDVPLCVWGVCVYDLFVARMIRQREVCDDDVFVDELYEGCMCG